MGKYICFMSALYHSDAVFVAPFISYDFPNAERISRTAAGAFCKEVGDEYRLPNVEEFASIFYNRLLVGTMIGAGQNYTGAGFWTSVYFDKERAYIYNFKVGTVYTRTEDEGWDVRCIRR